jgi:surfeit locus 1 family protein
VQGKLDYLHRVGFRLKGAEIPAAGWPSVVQLPEADQLAERLGYPLLPYQVLLDPDAESGYLRVWHAAPLDPGKNLGYALQWFLFAAGAAFFFLRHTLKRGAR